MEKIKTYLISGVTAKDMQKFIERYFISEDKWNSTIETRTSLVNRTDETLKTMASALAHWDILMSVHDALDFLEKPWKWLEEVNFVYHLAEAQSPSEISTEIDLKVFFEILGYVKEYSEDAYSVAEKLLEQLIDDEQF